MTTEIQLTITRTVKASAEMLFKAWLEPEAMKRFLCPMKGTTITDVNTNPCLEGEYNLVMNVGETSIPIYGKYKVFDEYKQLSFTWLSTHVGQNSLVSLSFRHISDNETELTLHHQGFDNEEERNNHNGGWNSILDNLTVIMKA